MWQERLRMADETAAVMNARRAAVLHKPKDPVLIVEDTKETQVLLQGICKSMGVDSVVAANGSLALQMLDSQKYSLYIVDLMMPVMDGRTFIENLKGIEPEAVVLVETALDAPGTIIDIMKMGVFDYIIKPIDPEIFQQTLHKAAEYKYLRDIERQQSLNTGKKLQSQIEWLNYKESRRVSAKDYAETKSVYNLKTSLSQGAGFGTLVTIIDVIKETKEQSGDRYMVNKDLVDVLLENNEYCRLQLDGLQAVTQIMESAIPLERTTSAVLMEALPGMMKTVLPYMEKKGLSLTFPEMKAHYNLAINFEKMGLMVEELTINAYKYAQRNSTINIFAHVSEGYFWLSFKNDVPQQPYGGIPREYEKLVVEPFFRLLPPDESAAKIEKFGFGLGLAVVDNVVRKHNGVFLIHDAQDHTGKDIRLCVLAEILLPVIIA
jgi:CheY-like chemotaxis protein